MTISLDDLHGGDAGRAGERFTLETLQGFEELGSRVVVIGGTAMRFLGSPVPSVDLDCLIHESDWDRHDVYDFIDARQWTHRHAYADSYLEVGGIEAPNRVWSSRASYRPVDLLDRTGTQRVSTVLAGHDVQAEIPALDGLAVMKAKALTDRAAQLHCVTDPTARAALAPEHYELIEGLDAAFFRRKSGKDLVDLVMLVDKGVELRKVAKHAEDLGIRRAMATGWRPVERDVMEEAERLLARHRLAGDPAAVLTELQGALAT